MKKTLQVHMLSTHKKPYPIEEWGKHLFDTTDGIYSDRLPKPRGQHLYWTTDEEIKGGDEGEHVIGNYSNRSTIDQISVVNNLGNNSILLQSGYDVTPSTIRKIVATTNPDLHGFDESKFIANSPTAIKGVTKIPNDFIEAYVKAQGNIKEVRVEYTDNTNVYCAEQWDAKKRGDDPDYLIKLNPDGSVIWYPSEEKTYTRQEMKVALKRLELLCPLWFHKHFDTWFENNYPQ